MNSWNPNKHINFYLFFILSMREGVCIHLFVLGMYIELISKYTPKQKGILANNMTI